jgi:hypothetical protein
VYSGIDDKTKAMLVSVSTTRLAVEDLEKYHRALERALLAFHTGKMADINKVGGLGGCGGTLEGGLSVLTDVRGCWN